MKLKEIILQVLRKKENSELIRQATWHIPNGLFDLRYQVVHIYKRYVLYESHINTHSVEEEITQAIVSGEY